MIETKAAKGKRAGRILAELRRHHPAAPALEFSTPFQLLIATILSAQCTDRKVNEVTPMLWRRWPTPRALAAAEPAELEAVLKPTGFFRQKAKAVRACAEAVAERFGGEVPRTMEELVTLPGVGRKTANVVLGNAFGIPGVVVDTHVIRVAGRLGLSASEDPEVIERDLMALLPEKEWTPFSNLLIRHGRATCMARKPRCPDCPIAALCPSFGGN